MSRRSKETLAVQLFPFLAVLVCTMGSLIFLLLVTTREVRQRALAFAAFQIAQSTKAEESPLPVLSISSPVPSLPDPEPSVTLIESDEEDDGYDAALAERERELSDLKSTWRLRANLLSKDRDQLRELVTLKKSEWETAIKRIASLQSDVAQLEADLGLLAAESAVPSEKIDEAERIQLQQQIALMRKRLKAAQTAEATSSNNRFQVIPFDPQTGTTRRPILIECTSAGIRFLPEDILITASDLEGFTHKVNPLAAGTGALINYWTVWNMNQRDPRSEPEPYVLMLVRPDGVYAYYVAMKMLSSIRTAQGYELIEDSAALKLPEVDFGAKTACQAAVDRLLSERERIFRSAVNSGDAGNVFGGVPGRKASGPGRPFDAPLGEPGSPATESRRTGGSSFTLNDITGGDNSVGSRSWERVENFQGRPRRGGRNGPESGAGSSLNPGNSADPTDAQGFAEGGPKGHGQPAELPEEMEPGGQQATENRGGKKAGSGARSSRGPNGTSPAGDEFDSLPYGVDEPEPDMPIGERPGRKSKSSKANGEAFDGASADAEDQSGDDPDAVGQSPAGSRPGSPSRSGRLSDSTGSASRFAHDPRNSTRPARPGERPQKSSLDPDKPLEPEMLAGRRWGYHETGASIGFEREVRVDVFEDRLVLSEKHSVPMGQGESKTETLERVAMALDLCSREWGRPPQGFFWAPRLKFVVRPEGNAHYEQVNAMMTRAGLATSHEFAKQSTSPEFGRTTAGTAKPPQKVATPPRTGGTR